MAFFNVVPFVLMQRLSANAGIVDPDRQNFYGFMGGMLGNSAVGLGVALALAKREGEQTPPAVQDQTLTITTQHLPPGIDGKPYTQTMTATGGTPPYLWSSTPTRFKGITLNSDGSFSGTANAGSKDGPISVLVTVTDSAKEPASTDQPFKLTILQPAT